ncbi:uncharacterized protein METZ01_LOCUS377078, partial [marine metagenome]
VINLRFWSENREKLINHGLLVRIENGGLILARSLQNVTLWQLYEGLDVVLPGRSDGSVTPAGSPPWKAAVDHRVVELTGVNRKILETDLAQLFAGDIHDATQGQ